jgi:hypothetical protein
MPNYTRIVKLPSNHSRGMRAQTLGKRMVARSIRPGQPMDAGPDAKVFPNNYIRAAVAYYDR